MTDIIIELENYYSIKLTRVDKDLFSKYESKNTYVLDDKSNIISLDLSSNNITNINIVSKIETLKNLDLSENFIDDLSPINKLRNIEKLSLINCGIIDLNFISNLSKLEVLNLSKNNFKRLGIFTFKNNKNIKSLNLDECGIQSILYLRQLKNLSYLNLGNNSIKDIAVLKNLIELQVLYLFNNEIEDISPLKNLKKLIQLYIYKNKIFDLSPLYFLVKSNNEGNGFFFNSYDNPLIYPPFEIIQRGDGPFIEWFDKVYEQPRLIIQHCLQNESRSLDLGYCGITDLELLEDFFKCTHIEELILSNEWAEYDGENWYKKNTLNLDIKNHRRIRNNLFELPSEIRKFKNLKRIIIGGDWNQKEKKWRIKNISTLRYLEKLEFINASNNEIAFVNILNNNNLIQLHLNNNRLRSFSLKKDSSIEALNLSNNKIYNLEFVQYLSKIKILDLHSNRISDFEYLIPIINKADKIFIDNNPIISKEGWKIEKYVNHLDLIKNHLSNLSTKNVRYKKYNLPVKVLLLGNQSSGKSTLLNYIINDKKNKKIEKSKGSTHILTIQKYPKELKGKQIPEVIYFDFGGQDYYHGLYNAFLTNEAINLILWNKSSNFNIARKDIENDLWTRDFTIRYWVNQLTYFFKKNSPAQNVNDENNSDNNHLINEIILLVQTHADELDNSRVSFIKNANTISILNEFYISLDNIEVEKNKSLKLNLKYLEEYLKLEISKKNENHINLRPSWYGDFLNFILNYNDYKPINIEELKLSYNRKKNRNESDNELHEFLKTDLDQLHRQGLILYYKDYDEINDVAWLNPQMLISHIHDNILSKNLLKDGGTIGKNDFLPIIGDKKLIKLLELQKVIFHDIHYERYIIPSFLPISNSQHQKNNYDIITFGLNNPIYILKFEEFIPFGIINQLICNFGKNPDSKYFWKDQVIFTINNEARILINLDFSNLEISVYINFIKHETNNNELIKKYIFNCLIAIYFDIEIIDYNDYKVYKNDNSLKLSLKYFMFFDVINKVPDDLYISVDGKWFVNAKEIDVSDYHILAYELEKIDYTDFKIDGISYLKKSINTKIYKEININNFQCFTDKKLNKMKKIFISYSRKDVDFKNELKKHLNILKTFDIADNWSCEELKIGKWNSQIQKELEDSDLIIYMLSANFLSSKYILEKEVQKGMDIINSNPSKNILCVIVSDFIGLDNIKNVIEYNDKSNLQDSLLKLNEYQYLPYGNVLNIVTNKNEEKIIPLANYHDIDSALKQITEKVMESLS